MKKKIILLFIVLLGLSWVASFSNMMDNPKEIQTHIQNAKELEGKEIYIDAIAEYQAALKSDPENVDILLKLAKDYLLIDDTKNYVSTLEQAIELEKEGSETALDTLMKYYLKNESEDKAAKYLRDYLMKSPDVAYAQKWYLKTKGSYRELYCRYDEMSGMYNDSMVVKSRGSYSIIDASGNRLLDVSYNELTPFMPDGFARTVNDKGKSIYIDKDGLTRVVPEAKYKKLGVLIDSRISAAKGKKYGYLDEKGEPVTDFVWDDITAFHSVGMAKQNGKWAIVNSKGKEKTKYIYEDVIVDAYDIACYQKRIFVKINGKYRLINQKGKTVANETFDNAKAFTDSGYAAVCKNGKWGFIDTEGKLVIDYRYDQAQSFANGYAAVRVGKYWGYVDQEGNLIIKPKFLEATSFSSEGSVAVKIEDEDEKDGAWRLIKLDIAS
uniref:WG repeat-containing protein n=1 Tax=Eubacterium cellulosolvens TaxID=29322 RepID=UPI0004837139|nr:WG repeat-containing protein [[Eubacterium] cellulosolvens]